MTSHDPSTQMPSTTSTALTNEQLRVVNHPLGHHALVLAVAGSGKTTTLAHRLQNLLQTHRIAPERILVLMFNRLAREQFKNRVASLQLGTAVSRQIHSFHSFSYRVLQRAKILGASTKVWAEEQQELQRICLHKAITALERSKTIPTGEIDIEQAELAISLWKGSLIPADEARAGYDGHPGMPQVYIEYERLRRQQGAITFDDFVPLALEWLLRENRQGESGYSHIIVDEYQDVNYGQQALIETLAGTRADVMAVGDDDQTIYEWRGARPEYITRQFESRFVAKPTSRYALTTSFRFGPLLAQSAENVVSLNITRRKKPVIAHRRNPATEISIIAAPAEQPADGNRELRKQVEVLARRWSSDGVLDLSDKIVVLGRTFSQLAGLEAEFLERQIGYRVVGQKPFFERREVSLLLDYIRTSQCLHEPLARSTTGRLLSILNVPKRYLPRADFERAAHAAEVRGMSLHWVLESLATSEDSPLTRTQREKSHELLHRLQRIEERLALSMRDAKVDIEWIISLLEYRSYFAEYYGDGESAGDRLSTLDAFLSYAGSLGLPAIELVRHLDRLDPSAGLKPAQQIVLTTVYRTKGLEYDYVIIPWCVDGVMPFYTVGDSLVFDRTGLVEEPEQSDPLESERRLFYVAITRARLGVLIGTVAPPRFGSQSNAVTLLASRFLYEMRVEATRDLLSALSGAPGAGQPPVGVRVVAAAARNRSLYNAVDNLVNRYLPEVGHDGLAARLNQLILAEPPEPLYYHEEYPPIVRSNARGRGGFHVPGSPSSIKIDRHTGIETAFDADDDGLPF